MLVEADRELWFDEVDQVWREGHPPPEAREQLYNVVIQSVGMYDRMVAKAISEDTGFTVAQAKEQLAHLPATVVRGSSYDSARRLVHDVRSHGGMAEMIPVGSP